MEMEIELKKQKETKTENYICMEFDLLINSEKVGWAYIFFDIKILLSIEISRENKNLFDNMLNGSGENIKLEEIYKTLIKEVRDKENLKNKLIIYECGYETSEDMELIESGDINYNCNSRDLSLIKEVN